MNNAIRTGTVELLRTGPQHSQPARMKLAESAN